MATAAPITSTIEQHYTIDQLGKLLSMSFERVRQLVMYEPGVLVIPASTPKSSTVRKGTNKRTRNSYRIPASVVQRFLRRYANPIAA
jgi:hypothetical protein